MYPIDGDGHSRPFLTMVDQLSRYTAVERMNSHKPDRVVDLWYKFWIHQMEKPKKLIADRGPAFIGSVWGSRCDLLDVQMCLISRECPLGNGMVGRSVGLAKLEFRCIRNDCRTLSDDQCLVLATISRNLTTNMRSGLSPSQITLGRSNMIDRVEEKQVLAINDRDVAAVDDQKQMAAIVKARDMVSQLDSERIIQTCANRPLRNNAEQFPQPNQPAHIFQRALKENRARWHMGYRTVVMVGRHVLVERGNEIFKIPSFQVRISVGDDKSEVTNDDALGN